MWIYDRPDWPNLQWNSDALSATLAEVRYRQGHLIGRLEGLGFELRKEASLITLTSDVVKSSAIEGETLNQDEVRSSIAQRLGMHIGGVTTVSRDVEGVVEMMLDATQRYSEPLTKQRVFDWRGSLFPTGRSGMHRITVGGWRTAESGPMQVISGPVGRERVHFEAPAANRLEKEMESFLDWFENFEEIDPVLKAGMAHLWFVTVHPFEDGNGRIARAIGDMALARADGIPDRFYSLSSQIELERKDYYDRLEKQQRSSLDVTEWLHWFLKCMGRAVCSAEATLSHVLLKAKIWDKMREKYPNDRQRLVVNLMMEDDFQGFINTSRYARITKCSNDTALRDIQALMKWEIFAQNPGGGRSTSYRLNC